MRTDKRILGTVSCVDASTKHAFLTQLLALGAKWGDLKAPKGGKKCNYLYVNADGVVIPLHDLYGHETTENVSTNRRFRTLGEIAKIKPSMLKMLCRYGFSLKDAAVNRSQFYGQLTDEYPDKVEYKIKSKFYYKLAILLYFKSVKEMINS